MQKIYIIGKVTGVDQQNLSLKFEVASQRLRIGGYEPVCPLDYVAANLSWHEAMRICIPLLISCQGYITIDPPHTTPGGLVEETIARWLQMPKIELLSY